MQRNEAIKKLRDGGVLNMRDRKENIFVKIQRNRQENGFVCWQRFVAKVKGNWTNWNDYLSLKDVMKIREQIIKNNSIN